MLASKYRLKSKVLFARVEIDGKLIQSKSFGMGVYNRNDNNVSRFGFIISTRISKKAVVRNKIKRIMADALREKLSLIKNGYDIVFLIKPSIVNLEVDQLKKEVYETIAKNLQNNTISNS